MGVDDASFGPLQLVVVGFETTEHFRGQIARELLELRGRGMIRVLDARMFHRSPEGALTEVDLSGLLAEPRIELGNPVASLLGLNGAGGNGNGARQPAEAFARTAGFALEDLRRLTDEIGPGDHTAILLVEHVWAARLRELVRDASGRLVAQGFLTPEVTMIVGAEIQARADAQAAIELANAARGAALVDALAVFARREDASAEETTGAAAQVVRTLVDGGFVDPGEASEAIAALATAGLIESAMVQAALMEAEDMLPGEDSPEP
jgi:hypothetical protein